MDIKTVGDREVTPPSAETWIPSIQLDLDEYAKWLALPETRQVIAESIEANTPLIQRLKPSEPDEPEC